MNEGAKAARGDCIMFVHADSLPPLDSVGLVGQAFSDPRVSLAAFKPIMDHRGRTMWGFSLLHHWKTHLGALFFRPVACIRGLKIFFGDQVSSHCSTFPSHSTGPAKRVGSRSESLTLAPFLLPRRPWWRGRTPSTP